MQYAKGEADLVYISFNSMIVRLKVYTTLSNKELRDCFNSMIVRLKDLTHPRRVSVNSVSIL